MTELADGDVRHVWVSSRRRRSRSLLTNQRLGKGWKREMTMMNHRSDEASLRDIECEDAVYEEVVGE